MERRRMLVEGLIAGFLAYSVVAGFFAILNVASGNSAFATALLLGEALGAQGPGPEGTAGLILAANGLHVLLSVAVGIAAAWMMTQLEHHHTIWYVVVMVFLAGFFLSIVVVGMLAAEVAAVATWEEITVANVLAAAVVGLYLARAHRELLRSIQEEMRE